MKKRPYLIMILILIIFIFIQGFGVRNSGFKVPGSRLQVPDSGFNIQDSGFKVPGSGFEVPGSGFNIQDSGFKVPGSGFKVPGSKMMVKDSIGFNVQDSEFKAQGSELRAWRVKSRVQNSLEIFAHTAMAQDNQGDEAIVGNAKKGKHFFKDVCRQCHSPGSPHKELTPMTKTMDQWQTYFKLRYLIHHKGVKLGEQSLLEVTTREMINHIKTFLIKHAADSDQPQTCG